MPLLEERLGLVVKSSTSEYKQNNLRKKVLFYVESAKLTVGEADVGYQQVLILK